MDVAGEIAPSISPIQMAGRLVLLASDADQAGFALVAAELITLVYAVLDAALGT